MTASAAMAIHPASVRRSGISRLRLAGARVALNARVAAGADLEFERGRIQKLIPISRAGRSAHPSGVTNSCAMVNLTGFLLLPGLVNAHDHLEFNLFPRLGNGPYANSEDWARDIYRPGDLPIRRQLAVPKSDRLWWGGVKNLLCGATTVCHHNPYCKEAFDGNFPVRVVKEYGWAHSLAFPERLAEAFRQTPPGAPFLIHLGEGTDARSEEEIFVLDELGALSGQTVVIHGVGLKSAGHELLRKRGAALVWCPTSNAFTLGKSLDWRTVRAAARVALGSDSALTSQGDLLDEVRAARKLDGANPEWLYSMVTDCAAQVLRLKNGEGTLRPGACADIVAVADRGRAPADALAESRFSCIECVVVAGELKLVSPDLARRWPAESLQGLESIEVEGVRRLVRAPVNALLGEARKHLGTVRLAGRRVSA